MSATPNLAAEAPVPVTARAPQLNRVAEWWRTFGRPPRIMGVDVARALAIIGMIGAHIGSVPDLVWADPATWGGVVHGRSSVLFAVLAGVSVSLVTGRTSLLPAEKILTARLKLVGRGAAVLVIGLFLELLNTNIAVILSLYGLLFIAATAFIHWNVRRLFTAAALVAILGPPLMAFIHGIFLDGWGSAIDFMLFGVYPITVWIAYLLLGMAIGRLRIETRKVAAGVLGLGIVLALVGYGAGALFSSNDPYGVKGDGDSSSWEEPDYVTIPGSEVDLDGFICDVMPGQWVSCYTLDLSDKDVGSVAWDDTTEGDDTYTVDWEGVWWSVRYALSSDEPHTGGVPDVVGSSGFALAVLGLCLLVARPLRWPLLPFAALGSMPLTVYTLHVISVVVLSGGPGGSVSNSNWAWLWSTVALTAVALLWATAIGKGPLERLVGWAGTAMARPPKMSPTPADTQ